MFRDGERASGKRTWVCNGDEKERSNWIRTGGLRYSSVAFHEAQCSKVDIKRRGSKGRCLGAQRERVKETNRKEKTKRWRVKRYAPT